jgi:hypothetical protein
MFGAAVGLGSGVRLFSGDAVKVGVFDRVIDCEIVRGLEIVREIVRVGIAV